MKLPEKKSILASLVFTCPDCGKKVLASSHQAALFERCPSCRRHVWDVYDAMMAEAYEPNKGAAKAQSIETTN